MIPAIARSKLGIIFKNASIAAALVFGLAQTAQADQNNNYQDLYIACNPAIDQASKLSCSFNLQPTEIKQGSDTEIAQGTRGRRRKSKVDGYYGGFSLGAISPSGGIEVIGDPTLPGLEDPSDIDYSTGFAGSIFGGVKFNEIIAAELEFLLGLGSGDTDGFNSEFQDFISSVRDSIEGTDVDLTGGLEAESDYSAFAIYASPRFNLPISEKFSVFISPGVGLSQTNINLKTETDLSFSGEGVPDDLQGQFDQFDQQVAAANLDVDQSTTGISFKVKAGAEFQISDSIEIFGQASYVTLPVNDDTTADSLNSLLAQGGLIFNF
jgi:opacity protein-like surface antigen